MTAGDIYTVAGNGANRFSGDGGSATKAGLEWPSSVAVHAAGNLVIADSYSNRVRTVAG
jgi:DNA-binding beta-propeller fold protein YncE